MSDNTGPSPLSDADREQAAQRIVRGVKEPRTHEVTFPSVESIDALDHLSSKCEVAGLGALGASSEAESHNEPVVPDDACRCWWDVPSSPHYDTEGHFVCALPRFHGGPHVDATDGVRWHGSVSVGTSGEPTRVAEGKAIRNPFTRRRDRLYAVLRNAGEGQSVADHLARKINEALPAPSAIDESKIAEILRDHQHAYTYTTQEGRRYVGCRCGERPESIRNPNDAWLAAHQSHMVAEWPGMW